MGKKNGLSSNPAEAARKAARQRELKKNKADREAAREHALVKKDTSTLENEIRHLEKIKAPAADIEILRAELKKAREAKDRYLQKNPEHRKFIYPHSQEAKSASEGQDDGRGLFRPDGKPRFPERSIYYHPVFNPWGAPPPGMPYAEKPPHLWASSSQTQNPPAPLRSHIPENDQAEESDDDDDDIVMPPGPPPPTAVIPEAAETSDEDEDDDDVVMPQGPPPSASSSAVFLGPPIQSHQSVMPPYPIYSGPPPGYGPNPPPLPPPTSYGVSLPPGPSYSPHIRPGQPYARPQQRPPPPPASLTPVPIAPTSRPLPPPNAPRGPSSFSRPPQANTIAAEPPTVKAGNPPAATSAVISSAPQLRDLKKEAVAFLPPSVRKHKTKAVQKARMAGLSKSIKANPDVGDEGDVADGGAEEGTFSRGSDHIPEETDATKQQSEGRESSLAVRLAADSTAESPEKEPPPVNFAKKIPVKSSLVGYYDSDEEEEGGVSDLDTADPANRERQEHVVATDTGEGTSDQGRSPKGRVNLVEALKVHLPVSATNGMGQSTKAKKAGGGGDGDYEKWLESIEGP